MCPAPLAPPLGPCRKQARVALNLQWSSVKESSLSWQRMPFSDPALSEGHSSQCAQLLLPRKHEFSSNVYFFFFLSCEGAANSECRQQSSEFDIVCCTVNYCRSFKAFVNLKIQPDPSLFSSCTREEVNV